MAAEIKIRAERRAGELLADTDEFGEHGGDRKSSARVSLENLSITRKQSSQWQVMAGAI